MVSAFAHVVAADITHFEGSAIHTGGEPLDDNPHGENPVFDSAT